MLKNGKGGNITSEKNEGTVNMKTIMKKEKDCQLTPDKFRTLNRFLSHERLYSTKNLYASFHTQKRTF